MTNENLYQLLSTSFKLTAKNILPVAIVCYLPQKINLINLSTLAPSKELLSEYKSTFDEKSYTCEFNMMLAMTDAEDVVTQLKLISEQNNHCDIALICYEKTGDFCHRHLVADWLNKSKLLDYEIEEYQL